MNTVASEKKRRMNELLSDHNTKITNTQEEKKQKERQIKSAKTEAEKKRLQEELGQIVNRLKLERDEREEERRRVEDEDEIYKELNNKFEEKKSDFEEAKKQFKKKEIDISELSKKAQEAHGAGNRRIEEFAEREKNSKFKTATQIASGVGGMMAGSLTPAAPVTSIIGGVIGATAGGMASGAIKNMAESKTGKRFTKIFGQSNTATYKKIMEQKTKDKNNLEKLADLTKEINSENK